MLEPRFRTLFSWWEGKRAGRALPDRRDVDAVELGPAVLPHVILVDLVGSGDCRYRVVGTEIVRRLGFDPTGKLLSQCFTGDYRAYLAGLLEAMVAQRRPIWSASLMQRPGRPPLVTQRLFLPFTRGGDAVEVVLAVHGFSPPEAGARPARPRAAEVLEDGALRELARRVLDPAAAK